MKQKELLLWVVAIAALALSLITVIGPKGLKSDAAMRPATMMQAEQINVPVVAYGWEGYDGSASDSGKPCRWMTSHGWEYGEMSLYGQCRGGLVSSPANVPVDVWH